LDTDGDPERARCLVDDRRAADAREYGRGLPHVRWIGDPQFQYLPADLVLEFV